MVNVNFEKIYPAIKSLATEILTIQATGDYKRAKLLIKNYGVETKLIKTIRDKLIELPIDIRPVFELDKKLGKL